MIYPILGMSVPVKEPESYKPYYYTLSMVKAYSNKYMEIKRNSLSSKELAKKLGVTKLSKFIRQREQWNSLTIPVSKAYFDALGITTNILAEAVELDFQQYLKYLFVPATYKRAYVPFKWSDSVHIFKEELSEYEAIQKCRQILDDNYPAFYPDYPGRSIAIVLNGHLLYSIHINSQRVYYDYEMPKFFCRSGNYYFPIMQE
ncbi:MAG: hypothetical protein KAH48_10185 [Chlorobi bacterium]|nr:hypothetical protein [Chlorobiota bacterium]